MLSIREKLPQSINRLCEKLDCQNTLFLYGECLFDLAFHEKKVKHYTFSTSLSLDSILYRLNLELDDFKVLNNELVLYYEKSSYHILKDDFLPEGIENRIYIEICFEDHDFVNRITKNVLSIDRVYMSATEIYGYKKLEEIVDTEAISLTQNLESQLCNNIFELVKYYRYKVKYNLHELKAIKPCIEKKPLKYHAKPYSWKKEFIKLIELEKPSECFEELRIHGVLEHFFEELLEGYQVNQNEYHEYDVYYHSLNAADAASPEEPLIRIAALFHDIGKPRSKKEVLKGEEQDARNVFYDHENIGARMTYQILKKFGFSHSTVLQISKLVRLHMFHYTAEWTDTAVRRLIRKADNDLGNLFKLRAADRLGSGKKEGESKAIKRLENRINQIIELDNRTTVKDLDINGNDLIQVFSIQPGPIIGKVLNYLLEKILEDETLNQNEILMELSKEWLEENAYIERS